MILHFCQSTNKQGVVYRQVTYNLIPRASYLRTG